MRGCEARSGVAEHVTIADVLCPGLDSDASMSVTTLGDLRAVTFEHPDAPKWWFGDWANAGASRFGVPPEDAYEAATIAAQAIAHQVYRGSLELPVAIVADATSLQLPDELTGDAWESLGGFLIWVHNEIEPSEIGKKLVFKFGEMYPADDLISEWLATIAMAANDLITVNVQMAETDDDSLRWYYFRAAAGHFHEVAKHLDETQRVPEVDEFAYSFAPSDLNAIQKHLWAESRPHPRDAWVPSASESRPPGRARSFAATSPPAPWPSTRTPHAPSLSYRWACAGPPCGVVQRER